MHNYLLIDDDNIFNYIHSEVIEKVEPDAKIKIFTSSTEGLNYLKKKLDAKEPLPHVLFLDIRMPELDGFEFLEQLNAYPAETVKQMSIYMLTSSLDDRDRMKANKNLLVKGFKSKTLTAGMLLDVLEELPARKTD